MSTKPETQEPPRPQPLHKRYKRELIIAFVVCALIVGVLAALFWPETKAAIGYAGAVMGSIVEYVRNAGAGWFFAAYAFLPAVGVPISLFNLTVSPTFAPTLGLGWVIVLSALCLAFNLAFSYWLARFALRPVIEKLVKKLGYALPVIPADEHVTACILLRVVPGAPYVMQSYILGLAKVRFLPYMVVSFLGQFGWALAMIIFGRAFMDGGSFKAGFVAVVLIVLLVIGTRIVRKRMTKKSARKLTANTDVTTDSTSEN